MQNTFVELRIAMASRWTRSLAVVLLIGCAVSFWSVFGQIRSYDEGFGSLKRTGAFETQQALDKWVASSPDQADARRIAATASPGMGVNHAIGLLGSLGPLLCVMWGASLIGSEFGLRTSRIRAAHTGWDTAVAAKALAIVPVIAVCVGMVATLGGVVQPVLASVIRGKFAWTGAIVAPQAPPILPQALAVFFGCVVFTLLGAALALVMRGTASAIVVGLFFMLFAQAPLGWWWLPENAYGALLAKVISYPAGGLVGGTPSMPRNPPAWDGYAVAVLAAWGIGLVIMLVMVARKQEIA